MKIDLVSTANFELGHPWAQCAWLRENAPVHWHEESDGPGFWAITKYDDIRTVSRQPRTFSSYARGTMLAEPDEMGLAAGRQMILNMDPPQHDRFKLLVSRGFTRRTRRPSRIGSRSSRPRSSMRWRRGECDFVADIGPAPPP
ncbi:MAG: hypothetical protein R2705_19630 [Ilumatobacteraceae bacterium]